MKVSSKWYYHFRCVWPGMPILSKITGLLFLCNILRKKWVMQLIFCMQISMKACFKVIYTLILMEMVKYSQSSQNSMFAVSLQYLKKEVRDEVDLLHEDVFYKLISTVWASKFSTRWYYHYWWAWSSIFKVLKVTSLQYFYNISKKNLGMEFIFCMQINIKTSTSWHYHFWWK